MWSYLCRWVRGADRARAALGWEGAADHTPGMPRSSPQQLDDECVTGAMPADMTPGDPTLQGEAASPENLHQGRSLRPLLIMATITLLSLWLVGEAWANTIGAVGGCGGG
jgi:hypothetical protein